MLLKGIDATTAPQGSAFPLCSTMHYVVFVAGTMHYVVFVAGTTHHPVFVAGTTFDVVAGFAVLDGFLASVDCCMNNVDFCYLTAQT
jgi:hypothetical protein